MWKVIIGTIMLTSNVALACKITSSSDWFLSEIDLAKKTKNIVEAKLIEVKEIEPNLSNLKFKIINRKKGELKDKYIVMKSIGKTDSKNSQYDKECNLQVNYSLNKKYLIYVDSFNPNTIKPLSDK